MQAHRIRILNYELALTMETSRPSMSLVLKLFRALPSQQRQAASQWAPQKHWAHSFVEGKQLPKEEHTTQAGTKRIAGNWRVEGSSIGCDLYSCLMSMSYVSMQATHSQRHNATAQVGLNLKPTKLNTTRMAIVTEFGLRPDKMNTSEIVGIWIYSFERYHFPKISFSCHFFLICLKRHRIRGLEPVIVLKDKLTTAFRRTVENFATTSFQN